MDDSLLVRRLERLGDLFGDGERLVNWDSALCNSVGERKPLDQFHDKCAGLSALLSRP